jgi:hypothetical protein
VVAAIAGFVWKADSNPPSNGFVTRQQAVQVFVSDPTAKVQLTAAYPALDPHQVLEDIYLSITPSVPGTDVSWALVSLDHPLDCVAPGQLFNMANPTSHHALAARLVFGSEPRKPPLWAWLCNGDTTGSSQASLASLKQLSFYGIGPLRKADPIAASLTNGALVASTPMAAVSNGSAGTYFARLPALDLDVLPESGVSLLVGIEHEVRLHEFRYLLDEAPQPLSPGQATATDVGSYQRPRGMIAELPTSFFNPANLSDQALLELTSTQSRLIDYKLDQVNPTNGSFENGNFVWRGTGYIEPTLALSDPNSDQARSSDAFLAGVAFAVAAAAFIAFVQELPERRRKEGTSD